MGGKLPKNGLLPFPFLHRKRWLHPSQEHPLMKAPGSEWPLSVQAVRTGPKLYPLPYAGPKIARPSTNAGGTAWALQLQEDREPWSKPLSSRKSEANKSGMMEKPRRTGKCLLPS